MSLYRCSSCDYAWNGDEPTKEKYDAMASNGQIEFAGLVDHQCPKCRTDENGEIVYLEIVS